jgi:chromosome segregation ATPase
MRVHRLDVEGLFSFGRGSQSLALRLNDGLTVVVGPNAVGKTNVGRSVSALQDVVRSNDTFNEGGFKG